VIRRTAAALLALVLAAGLAGCGDDDEPTAADENTTTTGAEAAEATFPVTVRDVTIEAKPERIVSLSATATEMLFAVGAGDQVVAADQYSTFPEEAPDTDLSGFDPNVEAISTYDPDLVVISRDADGIVAALGELEIPVLVMKTAATIGDSQQQLEDLGTATGHPEEGVEAAEELGTAVDEVVQELDGAGEGLTYYYELSDEHHTATSETFIGSALGALGLVNIADGAGDGSAYPQLSAEFVVEQDPDLILLANSEQQPAEAVAAREGWGEMQAVKGDGIVELDNDIASRWGPRIPLLLEAVAEAIQKVAA
jgi:iron complex transport system substrate-binding protein